MKVNLSSKNSSQLDLKVRGRVLSFADLNYKVLCLLVVTIFVFFRAFTAQYVTWDDPVLVLDNPLLKLPFLEVLPTFFTSFYHGDYIPLTLISYWLEVHLFGYSPVPSHIFNLLLHLGCGIALFEILRSFKIKENSIALICAIFLLHPLQVEPVMWISERKGLLSSLLLLSAMVCSQKASSSSEESLKILNFRSSASSRNFYQFSYYFLFLGSLLSKATGVFFPIFLIWMDVCNKKGTEALLFSKALKKHSVPLMCAFIIIIIRIDAYGGNLSNFSSVFLEPQRIFELPLIIASILGFYVSAFFLPFSQSIIYREFQIDPILLIRILILSAFVFALIGFWKKHRNSEIKFFLLFSLVLLLPVLQIVPRINLVSDRYMYLPSIGFAGLVAVLFERASKQIQKVGFFTIVVVLALVSCFRSDVWKNDLQLWSKAVKTAPWSGLARNNYAMVLEKMGDIQSAVVEFEAALLLGKRDGTDTLAYNNLGVLYSRPSKILDQKKAIEYFEKGIAGTQRLEETYTLRYNLGGSYASVGEFVKAKEILMKLETDLLTASRDKKYLELLEMTQGMIKRIRTDSR